MKLYVLSCLLLLATHVQANEGNYHLDEMLRKMVQENIIGAEEAHKTMIKSGLQQKRPGPAAISRGPASISGEPQVLDLNKEQMKLIQHEMRAFAPKKRH
jgi:hypothetical protein